MADFQNSFTGKNTGVYLPTGENMQRSQDRMSDLILNAEKLKYDTYRKNEQEFLKAADVNPVFVLAQSARDTQQKLLDNFNTKWGQTMKSSGGVLSTDDKMQMAKEKDYIMLQQDKMQSDMATMQLHQKMVAQNPNRWDESELNNWVSDYMKTGKYEHPEPPIKPLSLTDAAMKNINKVATKEFHDPNEDVVYGKGGTSYKDETIYSAQKQDVAPYIQASIANNDQYAAGALQEWQESGDIDRQKYHKENPSNPILAMMVDKHWKEWVKADVKTTRNIQATGGTKKQVEPQEAKDVGIIGQTAYPKFHDLGNRPISNVTPPLIRVLDPEGETPMKPASPITAILIGYDESRDEFIMESKANFQDLYGRRPKGANWRFAVKRTDLPDKYGDIETLSGGKLTKIKDIVPQTGTPTQKPTVTDLSGLFKNKGK